MDRASMIATAAAVVVGLGVQSQAKAALQYYVPFDGQSLANTGVVGGEVVTSAASSSSGSAASESPFGAGASYYMAGDQYLELPNSTGMFVQPGADKTTSMTVTAWVKGYSQWNEIVSKGQASAERPGWDLQCFSSSPAVFRTQFYQTVSNRGSFTPNPLESANSTQWTLVTMVMRADEKVSFYVNGQDVTNNDWALSVADDTTPIRIGANGTGWDRLTGYVDDVGLYDQALSAGKAAAIYGLATTPSLQYNLGNVDKLFSLYDVATGSVAVGGANWTYATGLSVAGGVGVVQQNEGGYFVPLADDGTGLIAAVPEPVSVGMLGLAMGLTLRRRRKA